MPEDALISCGKVYKRIILLSILPAFRNIEKTKIIGNKGMEGLLPVVHCLFFSSISLKEWLFVLPYREYNIIVESIRREFPVNKFWSPLKAYRKECVLGPAFKLLEALFELTVPLIIARLVDEGLRLHIHAVIIRCTLLLVLMALLGLAASVTAQYFAARAAIGFSSRLRHNLFDHIQTLSYSDLDRLGPSTLITRLTGDINQVQTGLNLGLRLLLRSPFVVFGAMIMAWTIDAGSILIFAGVIVLLFLIVFGIILGALPFQKRVRDQLDDVTGAARENLSGVRVIRAFVQENSQVSRFERINNLLTKLQLKTGRLTASMNPLTFLVLNAAIILLIRTGAVRVSSGSLTQGQLIALYNYMGQILVELVKLANLIVTLTKSAACARRISSILSADSSQAEGVLSIPDTPGDLVFDDVSVRYSSSGDPSLEHISFTAHPGETIGIIGGTGSGKSTLVSLIPRFYDVSSGAVLFGGHDVREYSLSSLRGAVGIVPQHAALFRGTIRSNLLWGNPDASDDELKEALSAAQGIDIIGKKELGLDEPVKQGGANFSGGQRQRLTIARALVRKPAVLILDDSTSALDYATDAALRKALRTLSFSPLTFIVSQRIASVRHADTILVLDDGECVGTGTHDELLRTCSVYREIFDAQQEKPAAAEGGAV